MNYGQTRSIHVCSGARFTMQCVGRSARSCSHIPARVSGSSSSRALSRPSRESLNFPLLGRRIINQATAVSLHTRRSCSRTSGHVSSPARYFSISTQSRLDQASSAPAPNESKPAEGLPAAKKGEYQPTTQDLATSGLNEQTLDAQLEDESRDWTRSFHGLSTEAFSPEAIKVLLAPIDPADIEVKPDGIIFLPEIKYRRILNAAFGPGAWGLAPRGETIVTAKSVTREYALVVLGRLVSIARGEQDYFGPEGIPTAVEGCKSTALRRCCKDLGVASDLWDPRFVREYLAQHVKEVAVEHQLTKKRRKLFLKKEEKLKYPWKEVR